MFRVVFATLLVLGVWTVSGNRVAADDEQEQKVRSPRVLKTEKKRVEIKFKRVERDSEQGRERKEAEIRRRNLSSREAVIEDGRAYLEKLIARQLKLEKSDDLEARKKNALLIRTTAAKLEDFLAGIRKEKFNPKVSGGKRVAKELTPNQREAGIKKLHVYLENLKAQQQKLEKSDDAEAREKIAIQIRLTSAKLEDYQATLRKETAVRKEKGVGREEHPEIRAAKNKLEHMRAAIKHLKEAGLKEHAQAVGQRAEKLQSVIQRSSAGSREQDKPRRDQDVIRKKERPQRDDDRRGSEADRRNAELKRAFGAYDKNKDGKVTAEEFDAVLGGKDNPKVRAVAAKQFGIADRNRDKSVSFEEFLVAGKHRPEGGESRGRRDGERDRRGSDREEVRRDVKREQSTRREGEENRELNQAVLQIRKELEELRKEVRQLRGERGVKR